MFFSSSESLSEDELPLEELLPDELDEESESLSESSFDAFPSDAKSFSLNKVKKIGYMTVDNITNPIIASFLIKLN